MRFKSIIFLISVLVASLSVESHIAWAQSPPNPGLSNTMEAPEAPKANRSDLFTAKDKSEAQAMCDDYARESGNTKCAPVRSYRAPAQWYCDCSK